MEKDPRHTWESIANMFMLIDRYEKLGWKGAAGTVAIALSDSSSMIALALLGQAMKATRHEPTEDEKTALDSLANDMEALAGDKTGAGLLRLQTAISDLDRRLNQGLS